MCDFWGDLGSYGEEKSVVQCDEYELMQFGSNL